VTVCLDLAGRPCLVVGGAGGRIGSAVAAAAAEAGASVGIITHNPDHADAATRELTSTGASVATAVADVEDEEALVAAIARIVDRLGPVRHLVNVVGGAMSVYDRAVEVDMASVDRLLARNLRYAIVSCREVAATLAHLDLTGSIVNISSGASLGRPRLGAYGAAKAGLDAYSRAMALELAPRGIRVNVLSLGAIRTDDAPRTEVPSIPARRKGDPEEVGHAAMFLLSDLAAYTTGAIVPVDGGAGLGDPGGEVLSGLAAGAPSGPP
jgi:3-oxoacyl-[acyl-carrier protein] reductase